MKYKQPEEFFKYLKEEFGLSVFNNSERCLAIASDIFEGNKQVTFLIKTAFNNKAYEKLLIAKNSSSENKAICIEKAINILTNDCCLETNKAKTVIGWLANIVYPNEWFSYIEHKYKSLSNSDQNDEKEQETSNNLLHTQNNLTLESLLTTPDLVTTQNKNNTWILDEIKLEMVYCPAGIFMMGSSTNEQGRYNDEIQHEVIITKPFMIGKYPVTQKQYETIMGNNPSKFKRYNNPIDSINWNEAISYCDKINFLYKAKLPKGYLFYLPTEAQWEYACRAGTSNKLKNNKIKIINNRALIDKNCYTFNEVAWYDKNSNNNTHPVGHKKPNDWGIYDMLGNVWEWCMDWYGDYPNYAESDPIRTCQNTGRIIRGGSWKNNQYCCRPSHRGSYSPTDCRDNIGFRIALVSID